MANWQQVNVVTLTMNFQFNQNGTCLNPERIELFNSGDITYFILVAQTPSGQWCEGIESPLVSFGAQYTHLRRTYSTRLAAINAALDMIRRNIAGKDQNVGRTGDFYRKLKLTIDTYRGSLR